MAALDYIAAGLLGAGQGFVQNQQNENKEAKLQKEMQRQAELLQAKEERIAAREMAKTKADQDFQLKKQKGQQDFDLKRDQSKRAQEIYDTGAKEEFELKKLGLQHKNALDVARVRGRGKTETDKARKAQDTIDERYYKAKQDLEFGEEMTDKKTWAKENFPNLYEDAGWNEGGEFTQGGSSKFQSIFDNVASRTKKGANDTPVKQLQEMPAHSRENPQPKPRAGEAQAASLPSAQDTTTKQVEQEVINNPDSVDIGQILGLFAKGVVSVGSMSIEGLKALKYVLENTGDISRSMTEPYKKLSAEVGKAIVNAGKTMVEPVPYKDKVSILNANKVN